MPSIEGKALRMQGRQGRKIVERNLERRCNHPKIGFKQKLDKDCGKEKSEMYFDINVNVIIQICNCGLHSEQALQ